MPQHDYVIDNQGSAAARADLNNLFQAIASQNSGATAPVTTYANMFWYETDTNTLWKRNEANSDWISIGVFDETAATFTPSGGAEIATQAEAEAGINNTKMMTPLRVFQALKSMTVDVQEFTTAGTATWTKPTDAIYSEIIVLGAGQGGRGGQQGMCVPTISGIAGNSGGYGQASRVASGLTATVTVTIGAGGTANTGTSGVGGTGGTSSFGAYVSATGGGSTAPGIGSGTGVFANSGLFADSGSVGAPSRFGYGGLSNTRLPQRGGGGGASFSTAVSAGGAGYVRIVTYCA